MNTARRGAAAAQRYLVTLYFCGVVTQFLLVGLGLFGMKPGDTIGKAQSLDPHREFGWLLTEFGGALLLLATLVAWQKPLRSRVGAYCCSARSASRSSLSSRPPASTTS